MPTGTGFLPPPYQPDVGFSPIRLEASAYQRRHSPPRARRRARRPALMSPAVGGLACRLRRHRRTCPRGAQPCRHCAPARDSRKRHYAQPSCKQRPRSPRGPLLGQGCVVLAVIAHTASAASLEPSRRFPVSRLWLYAESLPYGRVLAGLQTFQQIRGLNVPLWEPQPNSMCGILRQFPDGGILNTEVALVVEA
jgi:hypothetical protein